MRLVGFAVVALFCAACGPSAAVGGVVLVTTGGVEATNEVLDFGDVVVGQSAQQSVTVRNVGNAAVDVHLELDVGAVPPIFTVPLSPVTLGPGQVAVFTAQFSPAAAGLREAQFLVIAGTVPPPRFTLRGNGVLGGCTVDTSLDFGAVDVFGTRQLALTFNNRTSIPTTADIGAITSSSGQADAFRLDSAVALGHLAVPAGGSARTLVTFSPQVTGDDVALLKVIPTAWCDPVTVVLNGSGVTHLLSCTPSPLDFGFVTPDVTVQRTLTISNLASSPIRLSNVVSSYPDFAPQLLTITVPPATSTGPGTVMVPVSFRPSSVGPRSATLTATADDPSEPLLECDLRGQGGGPDIEVTPSVVDLGDVPFFGLTQPFFVTSRVTVRNVGPRPSIPDVAGNLHITSIDVVSMNADSPLSVLCVGVFDATTGTCTQGLPATYNAVVGLVGGNAIDLPIRVQPLDTGKNMEWQLRIHSNDPDRPIVSVAVKAHSVILPPCHAQVAPTSLAFGLVSPPSFREQTIQIRNLGTGPNDTCLVSQIDLAPGSDPTFRIVGGPITSFVLQPGELKLVTVRAGESGASGAAMGAVSIGISDPFSPQRTIPLTASIGTACLVATPSSLDFGSVRQTCNSETRQATLINTCSFPVDVSGCDTSPSSGFVTACMPSTIGPGAALSVPVKFNAAASGLTLGSLAVHLQQMGQGGDEVVPLRGFGDPSGSNIDSFTLTRRPADVLVVIDDSCSMMGTLPRLRAASSSFIAEARDAGIDFHLGVTIGGTNGSVGGPLVAEAGEPRILTPSTPSVEALFSNRMAEPLHGGDEQFATAALAALTAPLLNTVNAGFLRPDAQLAIVVISDAGDLSPAPALAYVNRLRAVKPDGRITFSATEPIVIPAPSGCSYDAYTNVSMENQIIDAFGGLKEDICPSDLASTLAQLGHFAFMPDYSSLPLKHSPDLTGSNVLVVSVNGQPVDATTPGGATVWSYDVATNSLRFAAAYQPQPGSTVTVSYAVPCY